MEDNIDTIIKIRNLNKVFKIANTDFIALNNINLDIKKGENIAIVGESGSGKSTLLNIISAIDSPTDGDLVIAQNNISSMSEKELSIWRGENIGVVFQFFQLLPTISVVENIILSMDFVKVIPKSERKKRALELLDVVGIRNQGIKYPSELSGGQQQRAAIARALANDPPIIVADEPTGNLDSETSSKIFQLFNKLNSEGKTIITVTHNLNKDSKYDQVIDIKDGKISSI